MPGPLEPFVSDCRRMTGKRMRSPGYGKTAEGGVPSGTCNLATMGFDGSGAPPQPHDLDASTNLLSYGATQAASSELRGRAAGGRTAGLVVSAQTDGGAATVAFDISGGEMTS